MTRPRDKTKMKATTTAAMTRRASSDEKPGGGGCWWWNRRTTTATSGGVYHESTGATVVVEPLRSPPLDPDQLSDSMAEVAAMRSQLLAFQSLVAEELRRKDDDNKDSSQTGATAPLRSRLEQVLAENERLKSELAARDARIADLQARLGRAAI